ncbi:MAG: hypothetical protein GX971_11840 [Firmicutes bacterium]|nr:hypothetical protein [Bacillota bacterium]
MNYEVLAGQIKARINELKSEQIGLRPFIQSDQNLWEALELAIKELNWVLSQLEEEE